MTLTQAGELLGASWRGDIVVAHVRYDSRRVEAGDIFVAIPGAHVDGHDYIKAARALGACAVVVERPVDVVDCPVAVVASTRRALSTLAAAANGYPARGLDVVGITGTDGKSTTSRMLHACWSGGGQVAGLLSTVEFRVGDKVEKNTTRQTTLESADIQEWLARMRDSGVVMVACETSSHALVLDRVEDIEMAGAVYTTITSEHLDIHKTREAYRAAKGHLIDLVRDGGFVVLNANDSYAYEYLRERASGKTLMTYSVGGEGDIVATDVISHGATTTATLRGILGAQRLVLPLPGSFNVDNALAALGAVVAQGGDVAGALEALATMTPVTGRMHPVDEGQPFLVVVDYAHTAAALDKILSEVRAVTKGRLIVVFGSAGERDVEKRPVMGSVAAQRADIVVIADEDPRGEDPQSIVDEIAQGAYAAGGTRDNVMTVCDRKKAIAHAFSLARAGDSVVLAGKGHESTIIYDGYETPWNEAQVASDLLRDMRGST